MHTVSVLHSDCSTLLSTSSSSSDSHNNQVAGKVWIEFVMPVKVFKVYFKCRDWNGGCGSGRYEKVRVQVGLETTGEFEQLGDIIDGETNSMWMEWAHVDKDKPFLGDRIVIEWTKPTQPSIAELYVDFAYKDAAFDLVAIPASDFADGDVPTFSAFEQNIYQFPAANYLNKLLEIGHSILVAGGDSQEKIWVVVCLATRGRGLWHIFPSFLANGQIASSK